MTLLPLRSACTIAVPTTSGSVVMGASGKPSLMRVRTMPGRTINTDAPEPTRASPRP